MAGHIPFPVVARYPRSGLSQNDDRFLIVAKCRWLSLPSPRHMRTLAMPKTAEPWSLTNLREELIKIGAKVVSHGRYVTLSAG